MSGTLSEPVSNKVMETKRHRPDFNGKNCSWQVFCRDRSFLSPFLHVAEKLELPEAAACYNSRPPLYGRRQWADSGQTRQRADTGGNGSQLEEAEAAGGQANQPGPGETHNAAFLPAAV